METVNIENHDNTGKYLKETTRGGADEVIDCVGMDGVMSVVDATDIITHKLSLDQGDHAYKIFDEKLDDCIKVILKP